MQEETRPGYYRDESGNWLKDRREAPDRRTYSTKFKHHDRRLAGRRKADHEYQEKDARMQIDEALEDFAAEHDK